jgi:hypothetical protein
VVNHLRSGRSIVGPLGNDDISLLGLRLLNNSVHGVSAVLDREARHAALQNNSLQISKWVEDEQGLFGAVKDMD